MTEHRSFHASSRFAFAVAALASALSTGCLGTDSPDETRYFFGEVYDGVTGKQVTDYHIELEYFGRRYAGSIDANGGFSLPAVPAYQDYDVYIDASGYRPFVSHQAQFENKVHAERGFHYEAFLFSNSVTVADVPITITLGDSASLPDGSIRLQPMSSSAIYENPDDLSAARGQVWPNDDDLLAQTVWVDFKAGAATIPGSSLVYGVPYQLSVLNVPGYQLQQTDVKTPFQAGVDGRRAFVLNRLDATPLQVSYVSTRDGNPSKDGTLTIVFNQPAEFDPLVSLGAYREAIDDAFSIDAEDTNNNFQTDTLNDNVDPNLQERGTSIALNGQQLVFSWDKTRGLRTYDPGDRILSITYGGLDSIRLRPVGGQAADVVTLSTLLTEGTSVTVPLSQ
jgi:hypothetical protein